MKILVAPLNWGLGHASRCIPLIRQYVQAGHDVTLAGDGDSLLLLKQTFPDLPQIGLAPLNLRYGKRKRQVLAMLRNLPQLLFSSFRDHQMMKVLDCIGGFDLIVSDNRFGLYPPHRRQNPTCRFVYITHQLHIALPDGWKWAERMAEYLHRKIYSNYDEVWVPDYQDERTSLAGKLSHPKRIDSKVKYIGPLSRMQPSRQTDNQYSIVAVLSGLEPQRSLLEEDIIRIYKNQPKKVLIVRGKPAAGKTTITQQSITCVATMRDCELIPILQGAEHIIMRSGYSSIMDMAQLGLLNKVTFIPTPGQSEQEYLAQHIHRLTNRLT